MVGQRENRKRLHAQLGEHIVNGGLGNAVFVRAFEGGLAALVEGLQGFGSFVAQLGRGLLGAVFRPLSMRPEEM